LAHLPPFPQIWILDLSDTRLSSAAIPGLCRFAPNVCVLCLNRTRLNDENLPEFRRRSRLRDLRLDGTLISDSGLTQFKTLTDLKNLSVRGTRVTTAGIQDLKQALPALEIDESDP